ncbi:MAG: helix-turn-helix domain-containing protein [bacterium]
MKRSREQEDAQARRRAEFIIQVQAGRLSAKAAAAMMGVSRKTYYKWEQRGLSGIVEGLKNGEPGRRQPPRDPRKETLQREVEQLRKKLEVQDQLQRIREVLQEKVAGNAGKSATEKKGGASDHDP